MAFCRLYRGELEEALASASDARAELDAAPERTPFLMSLALSLRSEIRLRMDLAEDSARDLEDVLEIFLANGPRPLVVALTGIRLARAYRVIGNGNGLGELIRRLRPMAARSGTNGKLTEAAFAELNRQAVAQRDGNADDSSRSEDWLAVLAP